MHPNHELLNLVPPEHIVKTITENLNQKKQTHNKSTQKHTLEQNQRKHTILTKYEKFNFTFEKR